jgi:hypothetical protein
MSTCHFFKIYIQEIQGPSNTDSVITIKMENKLTLFRLTNKVPEICFCKGNHQLLIYRIAHFWHVDRGTGGIGSFNLFYESSLLTVLKKL